MGADGNSVPLKVVSAAAALNETAFQGTLELDLGHLTAFDPSPADEAAFKADPNAATLEIGRAITQSLVAQIFDLPTEDTDIGPVAKLPDPTTRLPREKPLPKPKPMTRWQKFAKEKGIMKKKKSKLVFDEASQTWKRRYGYGGINDDKKVAIMDSKPGLEPGDDPFSAAKRAKQDRVAKNEKQKQTNLRNAQGKDGVNPAPTALTISSGLNFEGSRTGEQGKRVPMKHKDAVKDAFNMAQTSTASVGKFDKKMDGEKSIKIGKRQTFMSVEGGQQEKDLLNKTLTKVLKKEEKNVLDMEKAVRKFITDEQTANRDAKSDRNELGMKKRKGGGGAKGGGGKKGKK
mmetsp:Transcript_2676/g.3042  ORF Transcript_2676/g.3042 Transcript_2676/m.3042 type:complete len:345 (+) Transcript_2676:123-1157(+)